MITTRKKNTFKGLECYETQKLQQYPFIMKNIFEKNIINAVIFFVNMTSIKEKQIKGSVRSLLG